MILSQTKKSPLEFKLHFHGGEIMNNERECCGSDGCGGGDSGGGHIGGGRKWFMRFFLS